MAGTRSGIGIRRQWTKGGRDSETSSRLQPICPKAFDSCRSASGPPAAADGMRRILTSRQRRRGRFDYFIARLPRYRDALIRDLGLTNEQVDELIAGAARYAEAYRRGAYGYLLLHFTRAAAPSPPRQVTGLLDGTARGRGAPARRYSQRGRSSARARGRARVSGLHPGGAQPLHRGACPLRFVLGTLSVRSWPALDKNRKTRK